MLPFATAMPAGSALRRDDPVRGVPVQLLDAERYPNVVVYLDGLSQRPAFKQTFQSGST